MKEVIGPKEDPQTPDDIVTVLDLEYGKPERNYEKKINRQILLQLVSICLCLSLIEEVFFTRIF